jgi:uncharacterized protein YihD (DUF1040 family)
MNIKRIIEINKIIRLIRAAWLKYPQWRLCQLISNLFESQCDLYYKEDKSLLKYLKKELKRV